MVTIEQVRALAETLPRSYEALVRDRVKFRVGQIVYLAFSRDETLMGFAFPKEEREALIASEPDKFLMPERSDMRYNWVVVRLASLRSTKRRCARSSSRHGGWSSRSEFSRTTWIAEYSSYRAMVHGPCGHDEPVSSMTTLMLALRNASRGSQATTLRCRIADDAPRLVVVPAFLSHLHVRLRP